MDGNKDVLSGEVWGFVTGGLVPKIYRTLEGPFASGARRKQGFNRLLHMAKLRLLFFFFIH